MLPKYRRMLRRRAIVSLVDCLLVMLFLLVWMVAGQRVPLQKAIPYIKAPGHIIVQLSTFPDHAETKTYTKPNWTLYGDGTLIFQAGPDENLWRAQLSPREIQHILDVIINQDKFFDSTIQSYKEITSTHNDDELLLTVEANGQRKAIVLVNEPVQEMAVNDQTTHVFAIEQLLLNYHPTHTTFYAPNPDGGRGSDNG